MIVLWLYKGSVGYTIYERLSISPFRQSLFWTWNHFCLGLTWVYCVKVFAMYIWIIVKHYDNVIMITLASQITSLTVVYSTVYSDADQRKHQSSASLAFVWGIHRDRWIPRTKGQLRGKCFHLMTSSCFESILHIVKGWTIARLL